MATLVSQHVHLLGHHLGFFKTFILRKTAANFAEISRKHVFAVFNRNIIKNSLKEEITTIFPKDLQFSISNFNLHN